MYKFKGFAILTIVCLLGSVTFAQTRMKKTRKTRSKTCRTATIAKGMVVVGYEGACPILKPASNGLAICTGSPVPDGFSVFQAGLASTPASCPNGAFVIYSRSPAAPSMSRESVEAICDAEAEAETDRLVAKKMSTEFVVAMAGATRTICMMRNGYSEP